MTCTVTFPNKIPCDLFCITQVSLKEMYNGATRKLALQKNVICEDCNGLGGPEGAVQRCTNCRGSGMQVRLQQLGPGIMQQVQSVCRECQGQGERIDPKLRCKGCSGKKVGATHSQQYQMTI